MASFHHPHFGPWTPLSLKTALLQVSAFPDQASCAQCVPRNFGGRRATHQAALPGHCRKRNTRATQPCDAGQKEKTQGREPPTRKNGQTCHKISRAWPVPNPVSANRAKAGRRLPRVNRAFGEGTYPRAYRQGAPRFSFACEPGLCDLFIASD